MEMRWCCTSNLFVTRSIYYIIIRFCPQQCNCEMIVTTSGCLNNIEISVHVSVPAAISQATLDFEHIPVSYRHLETESGRRQSPFTAWAATTGGLICQVIFAATCAQPLVDSVRQSVCAQRHDPDDAAARQLLEPVSRRLAAFLPACVRQERLVSLAYLIEAQRCKTLQ